MEDSGPLRGRWLLRLKVVVWNGVVGSCPGVLLMPLGPWLQTSRSWCGSRAATT